MTTAAKSKLLNTCLQAFRDDKTDSGLLKDAAELLLNLVDDIEGGRIQHPDNLNWPRLAKACGGALLNMHKDLSAAIAKTQAHEDSVPIWVVLSVDLNQSCVFADAVPATNPRKAERVIRKIRHQAEVVEIISPCDFRLWCDDAIDDCKTTQSATESLENTVIWQTLPPDQDTAMTRLRRLLFVATTEIEKGVDFTCPTCDETHPPCIYCGGVIHCNPNDIYDDGEEPLMCDKCNTEMKAQEWH